MLAAAFKQHTTSSIKPAARICHNRGAPHLTCDYQIMQLQLRSSTNYPVPVPSHAHRSTIRLRATSVYYYYYYYYYYRPTHHVVPLPWVPSVDQVRRRRDLLSKGSSTRPFYALLHTDSNSRPPTPCSKPTTVLVPLQLKYSVFSNTLQKQLVLWITTLAFFNQQSTQPTTPVPRYVCVLMQFYFIR